MKIFKSEKYEFTLPAYVLAHHNCTDGFASYWSVVQALGEELAIYVPGFHNSGAPDRDTIPDGATVLMCDFSLVGDDMRELAERSDQIIVMDHHDGVREDLEELDSEIDNLTVVFDNDRSGAGITWDEFFAPISDRPELINYIEDRDLWNNSLPNWEEIGAYMQNVPRDLESYDKVMAMPIHQIALDGVGALATRKMMVADAVKGAHWGVFNIEGYGDISMPVANCTYPIGSETAAALIEKFEVSAAAYFLSTNNGSYRYGFRSIDEADGGIDVAELAQALGGNGHRSASGAGPFKDIIHARFKIPISSVDGS